MPTEPGQFCPEDNIFALTGNHQDLNQDGLFQNRPDNPFWSIPSTMELDDWSSYLSSLNTRWM
jgi:hypothetical protein